MRRSIWMLFGGLGLAIGFIFSFLWVYYYRLYYEGYLNRKPQNQNYWALLLADSHGLSLEQETAKGGIFNFSAESDNYEDMLRKLDWCLARNPTLKLVLVSADAHTLSHYRELMHNNDRSIYFQSITDRYQLEGIKGAYHWIKESVQFYVLLFNPKAADFIKRSLAGQALRLLGKKEEASLGNFDWRKPENRSFMARSRYESQFPDSARSDFLRHKLEILVSHCRQKGIRVVGIRFPLSSVYLDMVGDRSYGAENVLKALGCEVWDFRRAYMEHQDWFHDQDHLNRLGGKQFAQQLIKESRALRPSP